MIAIEFFKFVILDARYRLKSNIRHISRPLRTNTELHRDPAMNRTDSQIRYSRIPTWNNSADRGAGDATSLERSAAWRLRPTALGAENDA